MTPTSDSNAWSSSTQQQRNESLSKRQTGNQRDPLNQRQQQQSLLPSGLASKTTQAPAVSGKLNLLTFDRKRGKTNASGSSTDLESFGNASSSNNSVKSSREFIQRQANNSGAKDERSRLVSVLSFIMKLLIALVVIDLLIYFWPIEEPAVDPKVAAYKPRPKFQGSLAINRLLDTETELLFKDQFHAPESMAWTRDGRAFYTGVEGGFILLVEPYEERWSIVARLNSRRWPALDMSEGVQFISANETDSVRAENQRSSTSKSVPFCTTDVELYGPRAEFEPKLVPLSRCSRPLGIRLSPDETYLYTVDPMSGLYKIQLPTSNSPGDSSSKRAQVMKLIDFSKYHNRSLSFDHDKRIIFGDDIAIEFDSSTASGNQDLIYISDCSTRWSLRYLFRIILENDDTGRILRFQPNEKIIYKMESIVPVSVGSETPDTRNLSFPNGIELTADKTALLISDLNNRRILRHDLKTGKTRHLLWVPGYPDNVRRGLDTLDGRPTYWAGCGCAVSDGKFEIAEHFNEQLKMKTLLVKALHLSGRAAEHLGKLLDWVWLQDFGFELKSVWLKRDPYCNHGLVLQFDDAGQVLQSLHGPSYQSYFRLISEAHEVPIVGADSNSINSSTSSHLYLGSVYYSYLGRLKLSKFISHSN